MARTTLAIMTGGGDAPGLNAVIRAFVKRGVTDLGWQVYGIHDSFDGLLESPMRVWDLDRDAVRGILRMGGTILGTTNRGDPFNLEDGQDRSADVAKALRNLGCQGLIAIGGDGTMGICHQLMEKTGVKVIGVPKTIDNDIPGTEVTFGFDSAMSYATDAVDRLHATAEAHERVMVVEVMGRDAGHIALHAGVAGGADVILVPEVPFRIEPIVAKIERRKAQNRHFSIVVVAEGAAPEGGESVYHEAPGSNRLKLGGIGAWVAERIADETGIETRFTVLGHLQRGGNPTAYDRVLASRLGSAAVDLVLEERWGEMVAVRDGRIASLPLSEVGGKPSRKIDLDGDLVRTARGSGIAFGDEEL